MGRAFGAIQMIAAGILPGSMSTPGSLILHAIKPAVKYSSSGRVTLEATPVLCYLKGNYQA